MTQRIPARLRHAAIAGALAVSLTGCVEEKNDSTIYLDADGGVTWVVVSRGVRGHDPAGFAGFLAEADADRQPVAVALERLGAVRTITQVLRRKPPALVYVEARFDDFALPWARACEALGHQPESQVQQDGSRVTWSLTCRCRLDPASGECLESDNDDWTGVLSDLFDGLEVVLEEGQFVSATGFAYGRQTAALTLEDDDSGNASDETGNAVRDEAIRLSLTWERPAGR